MHARVIAGRCIIYRWRANCSKQEQTRTYVSRAHACLFSNFPRFNYYSPETHYDLIALSHFRASLSPISVPARRGSVVLSYVMRNVVRRELGRSKKDEEKRTDPRNDGEECFSNRGGLSERNKSNRRRSKDTRDGDDSGGDGRRRGTREEIFALLSFTPPRRRCSSSLRRLIIPSFC